MRNCKFEVFSVFVVLFIGVCNSSYVRQGSASNLGGLQADPIPPNQVHVVDKGTYLFRGAAIPLFTGPEFSISIQTQRKSEASLTVILQAINSIEFEIFFNNANGVVNDVIPVSATYRRGTPAEMDAEAKVKNIIGNSQQISFEDNGTINFVTDGETTKISFTLGQLPGPQPYHKTNPVDGKPLHYFPGTDKTADIIQNNKVPVVDSLVHHNAETRLLLGENPFRVSLHTMGQFGRVQTFVLQTVNTVVVYEVSYNNAQGSVNGVRVINKNDKAGTPTESEIQQIIQNCQQVTREANGALRIIKNDGSTYVDFSAPQSDSRRRNLHASRRMLQPAETLFVVPASYKINGANEPLFEGPPFQISIYNLQRPSTNILQFTFKALKTTRFEITHDNGRVIDYYDDIIDLGSGTLQQHSTQTKIEVLIYDCNKIVFRENGGIEFTQNEGLTTIVFDPPPPQSTTLEPQPTTPSSEYRN